LPRPHDPTLAAVSPSLASLTVYPVKSAAGLAVGRARVEPEGLEHDRRWMVVDGEGRFLTGREHPTLVRIAATPRGAGLELRAPGIDPLTLDDAGGGAPVTVSVWRDRVPARAVDARADAWFTALLGLPCILVRLPAGGARPVDPQYGRASDRVSFADGYPLLLIGEASLADLNARAPMHAAMSRFRPNLTVAGAAAYAEDGWTRIRVGEVAFDVPKPCDRCVMTTIDPHTAEKHATQEPLRTLAGYRRDRSRGILFGVNLIPRGTGTLRVGDAVEVLA
jgi:uncharacterized protein YcbX